MITWRYHILTIAAIFLALSLGVLIGIALTDSGRVNSSQQNLVSGIQQDLTSLRGQVDSLGRDNSINLRFQQDAFPFIVGGQLQGRKIAVIAADAAGSDIQRRLESAIHGAGGQVISTTVLNSRFDQKAMNDKVRNDWKDDPSYAGADDGTLINLIARQLDREIVKAGGEKMLSTLQGTLVDSTSGRYDIPADGVVIISRSDDKQTPAYSEVEKQMAIGLNELSVIAVGCETSDAPSSEIPIYLSADISSVDNLDSPIGQVSVVYALAGEKGNYGIKTTSNMLIPILRSPKSQTVAH